MIETEKDIGETIEDIELFLSNQKDATEVVLTELVPELSKEVEVTPAVANEENTISSDLSQGSAKDNLVTTEVTTPHIQTDNPKALPPDVDVPGTLLGRLVAGLVSRQERTCEHLAISLSSQPRTVQWDRHTQYKVNFCCAPAYLINFCEIQFSQH